MSSKASEKDVIDGTRLIVHSNNETSQEPESVKLDALPLIEEKRHKQTSTSSGDAAFKTYVTSDHHATILIQNNVSVFIFNRLCSSDASEASGVAAMGSILKNIDININSSSGMVRFFEIRQFFDVRQKNTNEEFEADTSREKSIPPGKACFIPSMKFRNVLQIADQCRRRRSSVSLLNRLEFCLSLMSSRAQLDLLMADQYQRRRSSVSLLNRLEFCLSLISSRVQLDFDITSDYLWRSKWNKLYQEL